MNSTASSGDGALHVIDRWEGGAGWIAHPDERMERASHVLSNDGEAWIVDPVDAPGVDDLVAEYGDVAGVVVLIGRHERDATTIARRHDVPVYRPPGVDRSFDAPVREFSGALEDTGYRVSRIVDIPVMGECALYDGETLVVADAVGTASYYRASGERLGVNPALRLVPPRSLRRYAPERILVGHGAGIHDDAERALHEALDGARRKLPSALWNAVANR